MKNEKIINDVIELVKKDPKNMIDIINAIVHGISENNKELCEKIVQRDKAVLILFERKDMGSEKNLEDTAKVLTENCFNGSEKVYTIEDVKRSFKK